MSKDLRVYDGNFSGGLFSSYGVLGTPAKSAKVLRNVRVDRGGFEQIQGTSLLSSKSGAAIKSLFGSEIGLVNKLLAYEGTNLWWVNGNTWENLRDDLATDRFWSFVLYNGLCYGTDGVSCLKVDTSVSGVSSAASAMVNKPSLDCRQFFIHNERMWAAVNGTSRVFYSGINRLAIGLPETWGYKDILDTTNVYYRGTVSTTLGSNAVTFNPAIPGTILPRMIGAQIQIDTDAKQYYIVSLGATGAGAITMSIDGGPKIPVLSVNGETFITLTQNVDGWLILRPYVLYNGTIPYSAGSVSGGSGTPFITGVGTLWSTFITSGAITLDVPVTQSYSGQVASIVPNGGERSFPNESSKGIVTGIGEIGRVLCAFTKDTITNLYGNVEDEFTSETVEFNNGCINWKTIKNIKNGLIYMGKNGRIFFFNGTVAKCITDYIEPIIADINPTYYDNCVAETDDFCYYLFYNSIAAGGTTNNRCLIFDTRLGESIPDYYKMSQNLIRGAWTGDHTIATACITKLNNILYIGDGENIHKFMDEAAKDFSGADIDMVVVTRDYDFREFPKTGVGDLKNFDELASFWLPESAACDVHFEYAIDNGAFTTVKDENGVERVISLLAAGEARGDRDPDSVTRAFITDFKKLEDTAGAKLGNFITFRFTHTGQGQTVNCRGIEVLASNASYPGK